MADESNTVRAALDRIYHALERTRPDESAEVIKALERLGRDLERKTTDEIRGVVEALEQLRQELKSYGGAGVIGYPQLENGPVEQVLGFNNNEIIVLKDATTKKPYFSSHGVLTDLQHNELPGSKVETTFPVDPARLGDSFKWPADQRKPYDRPPLDNRETTGHGYSKQAYFFDDGSSSLVTVGPSLPKIAVLKNGGAQFWVGSIGVITQGTGKYAGARGLSVYLGSAYLKTWPKNFDEQVKLLAGGFEALVSTYFKLVFRKDRPARLADEA